MTRKKSSSSPVRLILLIAFCTTFLTYLIQSPCSAVETIWYCQEQKNNFFSVQVSEGRVKLRFKANVTEREKEEIRAEVGVEVIDEVIDVDNSNTGFEVDNIVENKTIKQTINELLEFEEVENATPESILKIFASPDDDPMYPDQYYLTNSNNCDINAPEAWGRGYSGSGITVAAIDTGVKEDHEDLAGAISPNKWNYLSENDNVTDNKGHGTHVAGIIGASDNALGIIGIAYNCTILPIKVSEDGTMTITNVVKAINYAVEKNVDVINLSLGGLVDDPELRTAINNGYNAGIVLIAASGNYDAGTDNINIKYYPAAYDNVIGVASSDLNDRVSSFSNYGDWVNVTAPGSVIRSLGHTDADKYVNKSGTSMACPVVSGVAALIKQKGWSVSQIYNQLKYTAHNINSLNPNYKGLLGYGRIDAYAALGELVVTDPAPSAPASVTVLEEGTNSASLSWSVGSGLKSYVYVHDTSTSVEFELLADVETATSCSLTGLAAGKTYTLGVKAYNSAGYTSSMTTPISITTASVPAPASSGSGGGGHKNCFINTISF
ncbi:MAG: S8 family serine peptidase [bacterium]